MAEMETHGENIARVEARIGWAVEEFYRRQLCHEGKLKLFHAQDLRSFVTAMTGINAPGSADRIMRALRNPLGRLDYRVVSRRGSLYEPLWVRPRPGGSPEGKPVEPEPEPPYQGPPVQLELSMAEKNVALAECEARIEQHIKTAKQHYREIGRELGQIRSQRLYEATHKNSFEEYCQERWGFSRVHAHRMIEAAEVAESMLPMGNMPENERQARPLAALPPALRQEVWNEAVAASPNGKVTERVVREIVQARGAKRPAKKIKAKTPDKVRVLLSARNSEIAFLKQVLADVTACLREAGAIGKKRWNPDSCTKEELRQGLHRVLVAMTTRLNELQAGQEINRSQSVNRREEAAQPPFGAEDRSDDTKNKCGVSSVN